MWEKQKLIDLYKPQIRLHHNEEFYPVEIDYALGACELWQGKNKVISHGRVTQQTLVEKCNNLDDMTNLSTNKEFYLEIVDMDKLIGQPFLIENVPIYCTISEVQYDDGTGSKLYWDIAYHVLYLYNGPITIVGSEGIHYWDNEMVILRVLPNEAPSKSAIKYVFMSQHSAGAWVKPNNVSFNDTHPIIYSARNSHAHYPEASYWPRLFSFASDKTSDDGYHWDPIVKYVDLSKRRTGDLLWTHYNGLMHKGGQAFPFYRDLISINHKLYKLTTFDMIDKTIGGKKSKLGLGLIIIPLIFLIVAMIWKTVTIASILVSIPIFYSMYIGSSLYNHVGIK